MSKEKQMMDAIDVYLDTILTPQLEHMGVQSFPGAIEAVVTDIRRRLQSVLARWHDMEVRNTLLLLGREEERFMSRGLLLWRSARSLSSRFATACSKIWSFRAPPLSLTMSQRQRSRCKRRMFSRSRRRLSDTGKPLIYKVFRFRRPLQKTIPLDISVRTLLIPGMSSLAWQMRESV